MGDVTFKVSVPALGMTKTKRYPESTLVKDVVESFNLPQGAAYGLFLDDGTNPGVWLPLADSLAMHTAALVDSKTTNYIMPIPDEMAGSLGSGSGGGTKLFGVTLEDGLARDGFAYELPAVVDRCIEYLDAEGLEAEGLLRLSGSQAKINKLKAIYDEGGDPDLFEMGDPHVVAGLLKLYLRELAEPLLTFQLFHGWIAAGTADELATRTDMYRCLFAALPKPHRDLLRHLCAFLFRVQQFSSVNKMGIPNLATVIGPNILRLKDQSMMAIVQYTAHINQITGDLITVANETFSEPPLAGPFDYIAVAQAQFPYEAQYEGELSFPAEAFLFVIHKDDDGWWEGNYNGIIGIFPHNYVKVFLKLKEGNGVPTMAAQEEGALVDGAGTTEPIVEDEVAKVMSEALAGTSMAPDPAPIAAEPAAPVVAEASARPESDGSGSTQASPTEAGGDGAGGDGKAVRKKSKDKSRQTMGGIGKKAVLAEVERLRAMVDEERARYVKLSSGYDTLVDLSNALEGRVVDVQAHVDALETKRAELDEKLARVKSENKVLKSKIIDSESTSMAETAELAAELANVRNERNRMSESAAVADAEARALKSMVEDLNIRIAQHEANEAQLRGEETRLTSLLNKAVGELKATRDENSKLKVRIAELEESASNSAASIKESLTSGVASAQAELVETRLELQKMRRKVAEADTLQLQVNHLVQEKVTLQSELDARTAALRKAVEEKNAAPPPGASADAAKLQDENRRLARIAQDLTSKLKVAQAQANEVSTLRLELQRARARISALEAGTTGAAPAPAVPQHRAHAGHTYSATSTNTATASSTTMPRSLEDELNALEAELTMGVSQGAATPPPAAASGGPAPVASRRPSAQSHSMAQAQLSSILAMVQELTSCIGPFANVAAPLDAVTMRGSLQAVGGHIKSIKRGLDDVTNTAYDLEGHTVALVKFAMSILPSLPASSTDRVTLRDKTMTLATTVKSAVEFWKSRNGL